MRWRIAAQLVLIVGALVGISAATGVIDTGSLPGGSGSAERIDLIDEATIDIDLSKTQCVSVLEYSP